MRLFLERSAAVIDRLEEGFMAIALVAMTLVTFAHVVMRYIFGGGLIWSLEVTTYTFGWLVLVGMSYGVRTNTHIVVDLLSRSLSPKLRRMVVAIALILSLIYCGLMVYGSIVFVDRLMILGNAARDIPLPRWLLTGIMPIAFALLALRLVQVGWQSLKPSTHLAASR